MIMTQRQKSIKQYVEHKLSLAVLGATDYTNIDYYGDGLGGDFVQLTHNPDNPRKKKLPMLRVDVTGLDELGIYKAVADAL